MLGLTLRDYVIKTPAVLVLGVWATTSLAIIIDSQYIKPMRDDLASSCGSWQLKYNATELKDALAYKVDNWLNATDNLVGNLINKIENCEAEHATALHANGLIALEIDASVA